MVVVGGGVTGTGAALDAATRGLCVALIEARDYAAGASSKSSKLIHGGLRYLEMLDFGLVREALRERRLLLTELAPHLVKPVPFLWPLTHRWLGAAVRGRRAAAVRQLGGRRAVPRARHLSAGRARCGWPRRCGRKRWSAPSSSTTRRRTTRGWWRCWPGPRPGRRGARDQRRGWTACSREGGRVTGVTRAATCSPARTC